MQFFTSHWFFVSTVTLLVLLVATSFYRFVVVQDYVVAYEGPCDPVTESCYEECEDEDCTTTYFYSVIERPATEVFALCGSDVSSCDAAMSCAGNDDSCTIYFCNPDEGGCDEIN